MKEAITYVGLDAHKRTIAVCAIRAVDGELVEWTIPNSTATVRKLSGTLKRMAGEGIAHACYEAGPLGFSLQRQLERLGIACDVIAPSLIPRKAGERIKTDRRDARKLATSHRAGALTRVEPPNEEQEAARDLVRARDSVRIERKAARHRLLKFLDRRAIRYDGKNWTLRHREFLDGLQFENSLDQTTFAHYRLTISQADARLEHLDREIAVLGKTPPYCELVDRLRTLRGIDTLSAMVLVVELFEFGRFDSARSLMSFVGLVPSESSSGERERRGGITKTGNGRVRRILIEAAQHQRRPYRVSEALKRRRQGQPGWVVVIADRAGQRLSHRYRQLQGRGKPDQKIMAAVAREMAGFVWSFLAPQAQERTR